MSQKIDAIWTAYSFFHQKLQVYRYSKLEWQKDDIEYAIGEYVATMDADLFTEISAGNPDYLLRHESFLNELSAAVAKLETMLPTLPVL